MAQASQVLQTTVVQVGGGGPERYAERMARAREFCADSGAASAGPPAYATQPAASYGASAWADPNQSAQQQNYKQEEVRQVPQEMQVDAGGAFVVPTLVSPSAKQDMKAFVMESGPNGEAWVQCMVQRRKHGVYEMFLRDETRNLELGQFLCAVRKKKSNTFVMSSKKDQFDKETEHYLGKLKGNEMAGSFSLVDAGANPKKMSTWDRDDASSGEAGGKKCFARSELANISFASAKDKRLPDERFVKLSPSGRKVHSSPPNYEGGKLVQDFGGRVKKMSVKNFLLEDASSPGRRVMIFGRVAKDTFALDYAAPLSAMQAFGIALTAFSELSRRLGRVKWGGGNAASDSD